MEIAKATGYILEAGKSPELTALLATVADATALDGEPRYAPKICRDLARAIVCRKYSTAVLQLCHLVNAVDASGSADSGDDRWERFFFGMDKIRGSVIRAWLIKAATDHGWRRPGFNTAPDGVHISYTDGEFVLGYGRMPFLTALLEAIISMVGYEPVAQAFADMTARASDQDNIKDTANTLNRLIYNWLRDNLSTTQTAQKFDAILSWLKAGGTDGSALIDDEKIMTFWQQQNTGHAEVESDFRTFRSAVGGFVDFLRAIETGTSQSMVSYARPLGTDRDAGEIDPLVHEDDNPAGAWQTPLTLLDTPPADAIKFLNKKEREDLDFLMDCGPLALDLPLSVLRGEVFGAVQARITQALRRKAKSSDIIKLLACKDAETYSERTERFYDHENHLLRVQKAVLHVLTSAGSEDDDLADITDTQDPADEVDMSNVVPLFGATSLPDETRQESQSAFKSLNRKGFSDNDLEDPDIREGYSVAAGALVQTRDHLADFLVVLARLQSADQDMDDMYIADLQVFRNAFSDLYGAKK